MKKTASFILLGLTVVSQFSIQNTFANATDDALLKAQNLSNQILKNAGLTVVTTVTTRTSATAPRPRTYATPSTAATAEDIRKAQDLANQTLKNAGITVAPPVRTYTPSPAASPEDIKRAQDLANETLKNAGIKVVEPVVTHTPSTPANPRPYTPATPTVKDGPFTYPEPCGTYNNPCTQNPPYYDGDQVSACQNHPYPSDIDGHWSEIYIRRLYDLCIIEGYADQTYRPEQNITRAELTKMALYAAGIQPKVGCYDADCGSPFLDLDMWQGPWIRAAWERNIVQGYRNGRFAPNRDITRAEATKVILSSLGFSPLSTSRSFFNDVSGWSVGWIEQAHALGIVQGVGNGNFDPNRPITRAEAAKIIAKSIEREDTRIN